MMAFGLRDFSDPVHEIQRLAEVLEPELALQVMAFHDAPLRLDRAGELRYPLG